MKTVSKCQVRIIHRIPFRSEIFNLKDIITLFRGILKCPHCPLLTEEAAVLVPELRGIPVIGYFQGIPIGR